MTRLAQLSIDHLGCFGELRLRPGDLTLLLGGNGTGKSSLMDLLHGVHLACIGGVQLDEALPDWQLHPAPARLALDLQDQERSLRYELDLQPQGAEGASGVPRPVAVVGERVVAHGALIAELREGVLRGPGFSGQVPLLAPRSFLSSIRFAAGSPVHPLLDWLKGVWLLRMEPRRMRGSAQGPEASLGVSGGNFVAWLLSFERRRERLRRIVRALDGSIPGLIELSLEQAGREQVLVGRFADGRRVDFADLSDGQRCLIVLHGVLALAGKRCTLLLLDEPDAHVTPTEILPLCRALQELAGPRGPQVLVASHHPQVIDLLAADGAWELRLGADGALAEPFRVPREAGVPASRHLLLRPRP